MMKKGARGKKTKHMRILIKIRIPPQIPTSCSKNMLRSTEFELQYLHNYTDGTDRQGKLKEKRRAEFQNM